MSLIFVIWLRQDIRNCIIECIDLDAYMSLWVKVSQYKCSHKDVVKLIKCLFRFAWSYEWAHFYIFYTISQQFC